MRLITDGRGNPCPEKWKRLVDSASFNWSQGARNDDAGMTGVTSTKQAVLDYSTHRQTVTIRTVNLGDMTSKQFYIAGIHKVPKELTTPARNKSWCNPCIEWIVRGIHDITCIQEAHGFEPGGTIANYLKECGFALAYHQEGKAPPLAVIVKGPRRTRFARYSTQLRKFQG